MLFKEFRHVRISGMACALPDHKVLTDDYVTVFGNERVEKFKAATGIKSRYLSDGNQTASDLCFVAAKALMERKRITGNDIDALIFITQKPDYRTPSTAFVLQKRLELKKDCLVFDVNLGCSAFVNGVYFLAGLIESRTINRALLLVGDAETYRSQTDDVSQAMMFGDAGSATIIEEGEGIIRGMIRSDGEGYKTLISPRPGYRFPDYSFANDEKVNYMDGSDTFLFAITKVPKLFKDFFTTFNVSELDFDYIFLHQANKMIVNQIAKKLKLPLEKVPISIFNYGNTDGASIPVGIVDLLDNRKEKRLLNMITSGFGIGLSWGIVSFCIDSNDVLPMIYSNDYYKEGRDV